MGFGSVAASILLFIGVVVVASTFIVYMHSYAQDASSTLTVQKNSLLEDVGTSIVITESSVNSSANPDVITLYARNTGSTRLELSLVDVYVEGIRVSSGDVDIAVEPDTDVGNSLLWDPEEIIRVDVDRDVNGLTRVKLMTERGIGDEALISS